MTTPNTADSITMLSELGRRVEEVWQAQMRVEDASEFLRRHKGCLNEHQYPGKLETAGTDRKRVQQIVATQRRLRCSYLSGRLAVQCACQQLVTQRVSLARFIRYVTDAFGGITADLSINLLLSRCLDAVSRSRKAHDEAQKRRQVAAHTDLTEGNGRISILHAYDRLCASGISGQEPEGHPTDFAMMAIPLTGVYLGETPDAAVELNDRLVGLTESADDMVRCSDFYPRHSNYSMSKRDLNERQYADRLQAALFGDDGSSADLLKQQQREKRAEFLWFGFEVTEMYARLRKVTAELAELGAALKLEIENGQTGDTYRTVAKNNVIAAAAVCGALNTMARNWDDELNATTHLRLIGENSSRELLAAELAGELPRGNTEYPDAVERRGYEFGPVDRDGGL